MSVNVKKGLKFGITSGLIAGLVSMGICAWISTFPDLTEVSLSKAFRPWWRWSNWQMALFSFAFVSFVVGVLVACRPVRK